MDGFINLVVLFFEFCICFFFWCVRSIFPGFDFITYFPKRLAVNDL